MMRLVWCQGGNRRSSQLAVDAGWWYGFRSDDSHHATELGPVALVDSHWEQRKVDWERHLAVIAQVRPWLATIPDTLDLAELPRTLRQAEAVAKLGSCPLIVPKCEGLIEALPREVAGRRVVLGYSVPTSYGGTGVPVWGFRGWPVHLLGGSARAQRELVSYLDVCSADGNVAWRLARQGIVITPQGAGGKTLRQLDGQRWPGKDAHLEALRRSLGNLRIFWRSCDVEWREGEATREEPREREGQTHGAKAV